MANSQPDISSSSQRHAEAWASAWQSIDAQLSPLGLKAIEALKLNAGDVVLDIGCGTGQTLLQLSEHVGSTGRVIGVDIAKQLLEVAKQRTARLPQVALIEADAQTLSLGAASVDAVFSRFGVMAFADPVQAFANFRRMLKPRGSLAFCCWRSLEANELDHFPLAAAGLKVEADAAPFSFADPKHLYQTLEAAGFGDILIRARDEKVSSGDLDAMTSVLLQVGALGRIVRENQTLRCAAEPRLREALGALGDPSHVQLLASIWIVSAKA